MSVVSEQKIIDLSAKVVAVEDTPEFDCTIRELKEAIREHIESMRDKVSDLTFVVANKSESKADE
jgi:hypothetical protein